MEAISPHPPVVGGGGEWELFCVAQLFQEVEIQILCFFGGEGFPGQAWEHASQ